jgi:hypothetical protein
MLRRIGVGCALIPLCMMCWPGCGTGTGTGAGDTFDRPVPKIGRGGLYDVPSLGRRAVAGRSVGDLPCAPPTRPTFGAHLEIFANRRDLVIPAGIGVAPPRRRDGAYVTDGRCRYPLRTAEPTGLIEVEAGRRLTLGDFFDVWGQPLTRRRVLGFRARRGSSVAVFVNGRRMAGHPRSVPLERHHAIVVEVGGYFPPTKKYLFPDGL